MLPTGVIGIHSRERDREQVGLTIFFPNTGKAFDIQLVPVMSVVQRKEWIQRKEWMCDNRVPEEH